MQATQIAEQDLVISFDNTTVQIARASGKKTWGLLSFLDVYVWTVIILLGTRPPNSCGLETNLILPFSGQAQVFKSRQFLPDFDGCLPSMSQPYVLSIGSSK